MVGREIMKNNGDVWKGSVCEGSEGEPPVAENLTHTHHYHRRMWSRSTDFSPSHSYVMRLGFEYRP